VLPVGAIAASKEFVKSLNAADKRDSIPAGEFEGHEIFLFARKEQSRDQLLLAYKSKQKIKHLSLESLVKMDHFQKEPPLNLKVTTGAQGRSKGAST
jgi:hypothetical protein